MFSRLRASTALRAAPFVLAAILGACAHERPDTIVSPELESGITSSNGGGMRALGGQPDVGITTRVGPR